MTGTPKVRGVVSKLARPRVDSASETLAKREALEDEARIALDEAANGVAGSSGAVRFSAHRSL
jgi:hypothetical protein